MNEISVITENVKDHLALSSPNQRTTYQVQHSLFQVDKLCQNYSNLIQVSSALSCHS